MDLDKSHSRKRDDKPLETHSEPGTKQRPPRAVLADLAGTSAAASRRMTHEQRELMLFKRKLRNRESARRSRLRKQVRLAEAPGSPIQNISSPGVTPKNPTARRQHVNEFPESTDSPVSSGPESTNIPRHTSSLSELADLVVRIRDHDEGAMRLLHNHSSGSSVGSC